MVTMKKALKSFLMFVVVFGSLTFQSLAVRGQRNLGELLAYLENGDIVTLDPLTSEKTFLTNSKNYNGYTVSQDGQWIIATKLDFPETKLEIINIETKKIYEFGAIAFPETKNYPQVSPDGKKIIYVIGKRPDFHTIIADLSGSILSDFPYEMELSHWSNDSQSVFYFQPTDDGYGFFRMDLDIQEPRIIYSFPDVDGQSIYPITAIYQVQSSTFALTSQANMSFGGKIIFLSLEGDMAPIQYVVGGCNLLNGEEPVWSPDGKKIAYYEADDSLYNWGQAVSIYHLPELGNGDGYVKHIGQPAFINPRWSPDGSKISFTTADGNYGYYSIADESFTILTQDVLDDPFLGPPVGDCQRSTGHYASPSLRSSWSPSGNWLILNFPEMRLVNVISGNIQTIEGGSGPQWISSESAVNANQSTPTPTESVTLPISDNSDPGHSSWIAYVGEDDNIWLVRPDGTEKQQITYNAGGNLRYRNPQWSPNGERLGFIKTDGENENSKSSLIVNDILENHIYELKVDLASGYDWSPDGKQIVYDRPVEVDQSDPAWYVNIQLIKSEGLWVVDVESGVNKELLPRLRKYPLINPDWSPDGKHILFTEGTFDEVPVKNMIADVDNPSNIVTLDYGAGCDWSPDGGKLACSERSDIDSGPMRGPCVIKIIDLSGQPISSIPPYQNSCDSDVKWSPNGEKLLIYTYNFDDAIGFTSISYDVVSLASPDDRKTIYLNNFLYGWSPDSSWVFGKDSFINVNTDAKFPFGYGKDASWQPVNPTKPIQDMRIDLKSQADGENPFDLVWSNPITGIVINEHQLRSSGNLITEANWDQAELVDSSMVLGEKENRFQVANLETYKEFYFAAKIYSPNGGWSKISNVVHFIDTGFRENINGYIFGNYIDPGEVDKKMVLDLFQDDLNIICKPWTITSSSECELSGTGKKWMDDVNEKLKLGRCLGISSTSLKYYLDGAELRKKYEVDHLFSPRITKTLEVRQDIARYQIRQWALPYWDLFDDYINRIKPSDVITSLLNTMQDENADQLILITENHAVTPVALEGLTNGWWKIWVYNSNDINNKNDESWPHIYKINGLTEKWEIRDSFDKTTIGEGDDTIYTIPLAKIYGDQRFPIDKDSYSSWIFGDQVQVKINNIKNESIGFLNGKFIDEMVNAFIVPGIDGLEGSIMPIFVLPTDQIYTVLLKSLPDSNDTDASLSFYGKGSVFGMSSLRISKTSQDTLTIDAANTYYAYNNHDPQKVTITLAVDEDTQSTLITLNDVSMPAGGQFSLSRDPETGMLKFGLSGAGNYSLELDYSSSQGDQTFKSEPIEISAGSQHSFDLASWSQGADQKLAIDENADGTIEKKVKLANTLLTSEKGLRKNYQTLGIILLSIGILIFIVGLIGILNYRKLRKRL
jgi:Tol biopolymer transport system component